MLPIFNCTAINPLTNIKPDILSNNSNFCPVYIISLSQQLKVY